MWVKEADRAKEYRILQAVVTARYGPLTLFWREATRLLDVLFVLDRIIPYHLGCLQTVVLLSQPPICCHTCLDVELLF